MRFAILVCLSLLVSLARATETQSGATLFAQPDYRFAIVSWKSEPAKTKKKVSFLVSYEIPEKARFRLYITSPSGERSFVDAFADKELRERKKGQALLEFETDASVDKFYFGLWRGVGGNSPSGIDCDGALVSLPLKITPMFKHE
jgi:hypothetical protein